MLTFSEPPHLKSPPSRLCMGFSTLFSLPSLAIFFSYAWCTVVFTFFYSCLVNNLKPDSNLALLEPTKRAPHHGNERLWFLVFGNFCFAVLFALRDLVKDTNYAQWPKKTNVNFTDAVKNEIVECFSGPFWGDLAASATFTLAFTALYRTFRGVAWRWLVSYVSFSRPFVLNFAKTSRSSVSWSLGWYLFVSEIALLVILKPTLAVLDTYMTQPLNFASFTRKSPLNPEAYLLEAMKSQDPFYLDHTVMEIQRIVHAKKKRAIFFADPGKPSLTHELYRVMIIQLGRVYSTLTADGKPAKKEVPSAPVQPDMHTVTLKSGNIFKPPAKKSGIQSLVSTIVETTPRPTPAPIRDAAHVIHEKEVTLLKKAEKPVKEAEQWALGLPVIGPVLRWVKDVRGCYQNWAGNEWARRRVFNGVPEFDRFKRVVDSKLKNMEVQANDSPQDHDLRLCHRGPVRRRSGRSPRNAGGSRSRSLGRSNPADQAAEGGAEGLRLRQRRCPGTDRQGHRRH